MKMGGLILLASVNLVLLSLPAVPGLGIDEGFCGEMHVAVAETLCGGAYDCQSMPGTCCCLCGMNYGCLDRTQCEQKDGCRCRPPTPMKIEGEDNWPGGPETSDDDG